MKHLLRNPRFSWIALAVYLSALLGGTLHHHSEASCTEPAPGTGCKLQEGVSKTSCHEDSDSCTICTALHQAKAPPAVLDLTVGVAPVGNAIAHVLQPAIFSIPLVKQARGPPVIE
jgi:hypothetical protein